MEKEHMEILRRNMVPIGRQLYVDDAFLDYMGGGDDCIITDSMREEIEALPTKSRKASVFMSLLKKRGPTAFKKFIFALMDTHQSHLAESLHPGYAEEYRLQEEGAYMNTENERTYVKQITIQRQESIEEEEQGIDMNDGILMNIQVKKVDPFDHERTKYFEKPQNDVYKMNSKIKGRAVIINNRTFPTFPVPERNGTDIDATNMERLLQELGYIVITMIDLSSDGLLAFLSQESQNKDHYKYDSFICVILSHGGVNSIFGVDGREVTIEDITTFFDNNSCPALIEKPKLFIIQACQGQEYDEGVMAEGTDSKTDNVMDAQGDSRTINQATLAMRNLSLNEPKQEIFKGQKLPTKGDMLIAFPSYIGYRSWRNAEFGSWYIRALVEVFMKYSYKFHVEKLLKRVRRKVLKTTTINKNHYKQMTADYVSFTKEMYFFPGLELQKNTQVQPCDN